MLEKPWKKHVKLAKTKNTELTSYLQKRWDANYVFRDKASTICWNRLFRVLALKFPEVVTTSGNLRANKSLMLTVNIKLFTTLSIHYQKCVAARGEN